MNFISIPLTTLEEERGDITFQRTIDDRVKSFDNLVELIVFTPRGAFHADPDFGFEYWNHEYANVQSREFNNGHIGIIEGMSNEVTRQECEESVRTSLANYAPALREVQVSLTLTPIGSSETESTTHKVKSKYVVTLIVDGKYNDGIDDRRPYHKEVKFLMEPTAKRYK